MSVGVCECVRVCVCVCEYLSSPETEGRLLKRGTLVANAALTLGSSIVCSKPPHNNKSKNTIMY